MFTTKISSIINAIAIAIHPNIVDNNGDIKIIYVIVGIAIHVSVTLFIYFGLMQYFNLIQQDLDFTSSMRNTFGLFWMVSAVFLGVNATIVGILVFALKTAIQKSLKSNKKSTL